ncbi:MAG: homoserine kinase [Patescibacteria group bacterium]|nr:homoserine kinase [Patescibacteria group bacterium]
MSKIITSKKKYTAFAPATIANVGPGYDFLGFAIDGLGDKVTVTKTSKQGVTITSITGDDGRLPMETIGNSSSVVALKMLDDAGVEFGLEMVLEKGLPLESGLGSSGASSAAAAVATNAALDNRFDPEQLIEFARYGEEVAAGAPHADNVAPAILGGFVIVRHAEQQEIVSVDLPKNWFVAVCHPRIQLSTRKARKVMPESVSMRQLAVNASNAATIISAIHQNDMELFGRSLMSDVVVEPARIDLITGYAKVKDAALMAGAAGVSICGAGPSMFAVCGSQLRIDKISEAMAAAWNKMEIETDSYVSSFGAKGAKQIK